MVNNKQQELDRTKQELDRTKQELDRTKQELDRTKQELSQTEIPSQQAELSQKERELSQKERELSQKERDLSEEISEEKTHEQSAMKSDISGQFETKQYEKDGQTYKEISGSLGTPGTVVEHRSKTAQSAISRGTGDDAGHLIANQFGAPGDERNLSAQNRTMNQFGGTYKQMEEKWAEKLSEGYKIDVAVKDVTRSNEDRPFMRSVNWTETDPNGKEREYSLAFANTSTPLSREKVEEREIKEKTIEEEQEQDNSIGR